MSDHTENTLRAAAKALTDVIAPALDPKDPLAAEQLGLVVQYLDFVRSRIDHLYERQRLELSLSLQAAEALARLDLPALAAADLRENREEAQQVYQQLGAGTPALRQAARGLDAGIREVIRGVNAGADVGLRARVGQTVLEHEKQRVEFERSWYVPLGFDPEAAKVPPVADVLAAAGLRN